jgi:ligand-binding sensor domain-containing protein
MKKIAGIILVWLLIPEYNFAQIPFFQYYTLLKRNEPVHVNVIFQDHNGYIWAGTNKGLFRLDGIAQQQYTIADSLPDNQVTAIAEDSLGRIWTGHKNGKMAYLQQEHFELFDPPEGTSTNEISDILFDRRGNLWFSTYNDGLYYYTQERLFRVDEQEGMPDIFVYDILEDPMGNIWAGTDGGVAICTLSDKDINIQVLDYDHGLPDNIVKKIIIDDDKTVWLATEDAGIVSFDPASGRTRPLLPGQWKYGPVSDFTIQKDEVWIASPQSGLVVYDLLRGDGKVYKTNDDFDFMAAHTLLGDQEGNIWIGARGGLARTPGDRLEYINSFDSYTDANVLSLTVDTLGNIWYSTVEGLFERSVDAFGKANVEKKLMGTPFQKFTIISLYTDFQGSIWAGFYGEGVLRINPVTGEIVHLSQELSNGNILSITGHGEEVWLATLGGAAKVHIRDEELAVTNYSRADGLVSDYIYQVFIDSRERVWFATDGKGAAMLDESGFHHYDKGLGSNVVYGFAEDREGKLWVNTQGDGLYSFDGESFHPIDSPIPIRDKNINCLSTDSNGNLVMMHDLGIDAYEVAEHRIISMGDEVGLLARKPNLNAVAKNSKGQIFLGTDIGIVKYSVQLDSARSMPRPFIVSATVLDNAIDLASHVTLAYDENSVIVRYLGFWYQNPRALNFQYKLENYDRDWIESIDRSATYSNLPPGNYTFVLRVSDSEDFRGAKEALFRFTIQPPFWKTVWFYLLSAMVFVYGAYAFIKYSERKLVRDKKILEEKVMERTLEIQKQTEEIQAQNEEIQSQAEEIQGINDNLEALVQARTAELEKKTKASEESAFIIAHELRAPVASVLGLINLISKCDVGDETKEIVKHMEESAEKLNTVVREITKAIERGDK